MGFLLLLPILRQALANISVFAPADLKTEFENRYSHGIIPSSLGNFGNPPYGSTLTGQLIVEDAAHSEGCSPLPYLDEAALQASPILLLDRGDCAFAYKTLNAQNIGAKAVIIVNNVEGDITNFIMTDNGSGGNLAIPAFIISKSDGDLLKHKSSKRFTTITLSLTFDLKQSEGKGVDIRLWLQSSSKKAMKFISEFEPYVKELKGLKFEPNYYVWGCKVCEDRGYDREYDECISAGRYCSYDPDGTGKLEGRDIVLEDLRQICVHKVIGNEYHKWFTYVKGFYNQCFQLFNQECIDNMITKAKVKVESVEKCVQDSVLGQNIMLDDNRLMKEQDTLRLEEKVPFNPALFINNVLFRGDLEAEAVLQAICTGYKKEFRPEICGGEVAVVVKENDKSWWVIVLLVAIVVLVAALLIVYRMWLSRELKYDMKAQVGEAVAQYFQLADLKK